jgi:hypothetical protein
MRKRYSDYDKRKYAKWTDVTTPVNATIIDMCDETMPRNGEVKLVAYFPEEEFRFAVILNQENRKALAQITGSENPIDAMRTRVQLYNNPTVKNPQTGEYGAVRIRPVPAAAANPAATPVAKSLDEINAELAAERSY